jgi:hypothetical protein
MIMPDRRKTMKHLKSSSTTTGDTSDLNEDIMKYELAKPIDTMVITFNISILVSSERILLVKCQDIASHRGLKAVLTHADDMFVNIEFMRAHRSNTDMDFMLAAEDVFDQLIDYTPRIEVHTSMLY